MYQKTKNMWEYINIVQLIGNDMSPTPKGGVYWAS